MNKTWLFIILIADRCSSDSICQVARTDHAGGNILIEYLK